MNIGIKTASAVLFTLASLATLNAAPAATLPAESTKLIQDSTSLSLDDFAQLVHKLAALSPDLADEVLRSALATRPQWQDAEVVKLFGAVASSLPDTHFALSLVPMAVREAIETGVVKEDEVRDPMAIKLLNVIAANAAFNEEQRARIAPLIAQDIMNREAACIRDLASGRLPVTTDLFAEDLYHAKENQRSYYTLLDEEDPTPAPEDVTVAQ